MKTILAALFSAILLGGCAALHGSAPFAGSENGSASDAGASPEGKGDRADHG